MQQPELSWSLAEWKVLQKTGIPPIFAQSLKDIAHTHKIAIALRAQSPFYRYMLPSAPKPISIKAKTGNWGFIKGVIAVDTRLGKIEKNGANWQPVERQPDDLPCLDYITHMSHTVSLQEILSGIQSGEYALVGTELDVAHSGYLIVKPHAKFPTDSEIIFAINLNEPISRLQPSLAIDSQIISAAMSYDANEPIWWQDSFGKFKERLLYYYPALYKSASDEEFNEIAIYALINNDQPSLPITGDQDLLWISIPASMHDGMFKDFNEVIDTSTLAGSEKMYVQRIELYLKLGYTIEEAENKISNKSIAGLGHLTAYEAYIIDEINSAFSLSGISHLHNLIQHAPENHNPGKPASLNSNAVHIWQGQIFMTATEKELISFVLQPQYPKENIICIHPKWDMSKWGAVVARQLALNEPVPADTLAAYQAYCMKASTISFFGAAQWRRHYGA